MKNIELGDTVQCTVTGFKGVAVMKTEFLNGCIQYSVAPKVGKDNKIIEDVSIDEGSLKVIKKKTKPRQRSSTGGPNTISKRLRGF